MSFRAGRSPVARVEVRGVDDPLDIAEQRFPGGQAEPTPKREMRSNSLGGLGRMTSSTISSPHAISVTDALIGRVSIRAFRPEPVPKAMIRDILEVARYAPSGSNMQPWRVIVVAGEARRRVVETVRTARAENPQGEGAEYPTRPSPIWEPYRSRRFKVGEIGRAHV